MDARSSLLWGLLSGLLVLSPARPGLAQPDAAPPSEDAGVSGAPGTPTDEEGAAAPEDGTPEDGAPEDGAPEDGAPEDQTPDAGEPSPLPPVTLEESGDDEPSLQDQSDILMVDDPPPAREVLRCQAARLEDLSGDISSVSLEDLLSGNITSSYSRSAERVDSVSAAITVITREQILMWGYQSVAEILDHIVGFYTVDDHVLPNVGVRGIQGGLRAESGLMKVMIDGRPVSFRPTGGNWIGPELVPFSIVERIEIVRGPTSTVYGADAFLGVINVVTRSGSSVCGAEVRTHGSYAGGWGGGLDLAVGGRYEGLEALAAIRLDRTDRSGLRLPTSSPAPNLRLGVMADRPASLVQDSASIYTRLVYHLDPNNEVALTSQLVAIDRGGDFADWQQLASGLDAAGHTRGTQISVARGFVNLSGSFRLVPEVQLTVNAGFFLGEPTDAERIDVGGDVSYARRSMDFRAGLVDANVEANPLPQLRVVGGVDLIVDSQTLPGTLRYLYEDAGSMVAGSLIAEASDVQGRREFVNFGGYLLGTWTPTAAAIPGDEDPNDLVLRIDAGLRYDYNNIYDSQVNGRVGSSLRLVEQFTLRVNYASAFRAPTPLLLYGRPLAAGDILGNSGLRPQQIHTVEGGALWQPWEWLRLSTALSYSYVTQKAAFVQIGVNSVALNLAELGVYAWETEARVNWEDQVSAYVNFALVLGTQNLAEEGYRADLLGSEVEAYPPAVLNGGLAWRVREIPLRITAEGRFVSERRASDRNILEAGAVYYLDAAFYLDASVALVDVHFFEGKSTTLSFSVRNILGTDAPHPGFGGIEYPSAPRTWMLQWIQQI